MSAPAEHLRTTPEDARRLAELEQRVDELLAERIRMQRANDDLRDQLDGCRNTVERQQTEFEQWRLRPAPRPARYTTRNVPTGDLT